MACFINSPSKKTEPRFPEVRSLPFFLIKISNTRKILRRSFFPACRRGPSCADIRADGTCLRRIPVVKSFHDGEAHIQSDQIAQRQRSHREVGSQLHSLIDIFRLCHADLPEMPTASLIIGMRIRFTTNPGASSTLTGLLPRDPASSIMVSVVFSEVDNPRMTSTSFIAGTGLKKCDCR